MREDDVDARFHWDEQGELVVSLPPEDDILQGLLIGDLGAWTWRVENLLAWLDQSPSHLADFSLEGYAFEISGQVVTISSNYDLFPDTPFPLARLRDTVAAYDAWLRENPPRRPAT